MKRAEQIVTAIQVISFVLIIPLILVFWITKIFGNFMSIGADSALEIISNLNNNLFQNDSNGNEVSK